MGVMRQSYFDEALEPGHVTAYRRDGYAVVRGVFGPADLAALSEAFDRQKAEGLKLGKSWRHGNRCYRLNDDPATGLGVTMVQWPSYADPVLARYRNDPRLLAIDTAVMGVAAWSFADAPTRVGRRLSEAEAEAVMKKSGVAAVRQMLYGTSRR